MPACHNGIATIQVEAEPRGGRGGGGRSSGGRSSYSSSSRSSYSSSRSSYSSRSSSSSSSSRLRFCDNYCWQQAWKPLKLSFFSQEKLVFQIKLILSAIIIIKIIQLAWVFRKRALICQLETRYVLMMFTFYERSRAAGARRFSLFSSSGGSRWVAPSSARWTSASSSWWTSASSSFSSSRAHNI